MTEESSDRDGGPYIMHARWSFSLNFLPLVRAPIVSGQPTKNI